MEHRLAIEPGSSDYVVAWAGACDAVRRFDGSPEELTHCRRAVLALAAALRREGFDARAMHRFVLAMVTTRAEVAGPGTARLAELVHEWLAEPPPGDRRDA